tara:strand:- start:169 stop:351 length:183 start_codon:yes stop_codon:yes gene_type:complete
MVKRDKKYTQLTTRLIAEETEADEYIERMNKKLNEDWTIEKDWHKGYKAWHIRIYREMSL